MITVRNLVVFVGTVAASGLAGSSVGLLPAQHDPVPKAPVSPLLATGNPNQNQQAQRSSGGVAQSWIGGPGPVGVVAHAYPGAINDYRRNRFDYAKARKLTIPELKPVEYDPGVLSDIAAARLSDMLTKHFAGVINSRDQDIANELDARQVPFSSAAILVFKGYLGDPPDQRTAIAAWAKEPITSAVLDNPAWDDIGFASRHVVTSRAGEQMGYYLQVVIFRQR
jgi:hypothetical protein